MTERQIVKEEYICFAKPKMLDVSGISCRF